MIVAYYRRVGDDMYCYTAPPPLISGTFLDFFVVEESFILEDTVIWHEPPWEQKIY